MESSDPRASLDAINAELEKLQGTWKQTRYEKDGMKDPIDEKGWEPTTIFLGNTFTVKLADGSIPIKGTVRLNPFKEPKELEYTDTFGEDAGKAFPGIYSLKGDQFIFCVSDPGQERPREFTTGPGQVLRVSQRVNP